MTLDAPLRGLALAAVAVLALGCVSGPGPIRPPSADDAMLYGSLDLPAQVRDQVQWLILYKLGEVYAPPFKVPLKARVFPNGDFYIENASPGTYFIHHVAAGFEAFYFYPPKMSEMEQVVLANATQATPSSLTYLGRFRIHDWKPGMQSKLSPQVGSVRMLAAAPGTGPEPLPNFMNQKSVLAAGAGTFSLERTRPTSDDARVLRHVLEEVRGTGWDARIEARLAARSADSSTP